MLLAGEVDARTTINDDNLADVFYTRASISSVKLAVFYPVERPAISGISDLDNMKGVVISTTMQESKFSPVQNYLRRNGMPFQFVPSEAAAIEALKAGDIDYVLGLKYTALLLNKKYLQHYDIAEPISNFHFAISAQSVFADRIKEIDQQLQLAHDSGLVDFLDQKYLLQWLLYSGENCEIN